jgi:hypothetical protein
VLHQAAIIQDRDFEGEDLADLELLLVRADVGTPVVTDFVPVAS